MKDIPLDQAVALVRACQKLNCDTAAQLFAMLERRCTEAKTLRETLLDANEVCRSAYSIAQRAGAETNWRPFTRRLNKALKRQHALLHHKLCV